MEFWSKTSLKKSIEVHFSTKDISIVFLRHIWSICEKKGLADVLLIHAEKWHRISSFYKKRVDTAKGYISNSSKTFLNQWKSMGFRELQKKKTGNF